MDSWINALRNDKNEIFRAAKDANRAADFLLALELEKGIAEEQLATEPPETTIAARQNALSAFERETEDLERAEVAVKDSAIDRVAEQAFEPANPPRFKPGDKIVAFEPYHYGGKPKKEPETPGVVQSVYADGQYVSYMRLDGKGSLRENGNKAVDDRGLRLANAADLKQFEKQFAQLESKFSETSRHTAQYEPETGTVNIHDKHSVTDHRTPVDDSAARSAHAGKQPQSLRNSFSEAQTISKQSMDDSAKTYAAQTDSGIYRGEIIGHTDLHVVQRLNGESAVAHMKHILSRIPERGENVLVKYSKDGARVDDMQAKSRSKELAR